MAKNTSSAYLVLALVITGLVLVVLGLTNAKSSTYVAYHPRITAPDMFAETAAAPIWAYRLNSRTYLLLPDSVFTAITSWWVLRSREEQHNGITDFLNNELEAIRDNPDIYRTNHFRNTKSFDGLTVIDAMALEKRFLENESDILLTKYIASCHENAAPDAAPNCQRQKAAFKRSLTFDISFSVNELFMMHLKSDDIAAVVFERNEPTFYQELRVVSESHENRTLEYLEIGDEEILLSTAIH